MIFIKNILILIYFIYIKYIYIKKIKSYPHLKKIDKYTIFFLISKNKKFDIFIIILNSSNNYFVFVILKKTKID